MKRLALWTTLAVLSPHLCGEIRILAVTSAADFQAGMPERGSLASVFCTGLSGITGVVAAQGYPLPTSLARVTVRAGTTAAPLLAVADLGGYQQINFQVPWEADRIDGLTVGQGDLSATVIDLKTSEWPAFFQNPPGRVVAQHAETYRLVTPEDPALPGEWIIAYGTNFGPVQNRPASGQPAAADPLSRVTSQFGFTLSGGETSFSVSTNFAGLAPGLVGVYQVNFRVPAEFPAGDAALAIEKQKFCGFFFVQGCGRGWVTIRGPQITLPVGRS